MLLLESAAEWQGYVMVRGAQLLGVALLVAGCSTASTATYAPGQLPIEATEGRIVASRAVEIAGNNSMIGLSAGATIGFSVVGLTGLAAAVGSGGVQGLVALLGALGGAGIGYLAEERIRSREGIEYIVEMADGRTATVVQSHEGPEPPLPEGAPVLVVQVGGLFSQVVERGHVERSGAGGAAGWVNPDTPLPGATPPPPEAEEVADCAAEGNPIRRQLCLVKQQLRQLEAAATKK
jgi:outer membrane lipoprotein SlyB